MLRLGIERHTFTILGRCPATGALGIGIATYSMAVGSYCPSIEPGVGTMSSQAFADPRLRPLCMNLLRMGFPANKVLKELTESDPYIDFRQIGIVDSNGQAAVHTGPKTRPWSGHIIGEGYITMGNVLTGEQVVKSMASSFESSASDDLEERLMAAVESGRDSGGQPEGQRSAALIVYREESYPWIDLRVDVHDEPVGELRRAYELYKPMVSYYYHLRPKDPSNTPTQQEWIRNQQNALDIN